MKNNIFKVMAVAVVAFCCVSCDKISELTGDKKEDPEVIKREYGEKVNGAYYKANGNSATISRPYHEDAENWFSMTSFTIPSQVTIDGKTYTVTGIGEDAFQDCTSLKSITIPEGVKSIGNGAFMNSGITSISLPNSLETLGNIVFNRFFTICFNLF